MPDPTHPPDTEDPIPNARWSNTRVPEFLRRYANCMADLAEAREALAALAKEADEAGLNHRALKRAIRLIADDTGKAKLREENDLTDLIGYMRDAGNPLELE